MDTAPPETGVPPVAAVPAPEPPVVPAPTATPKKASKKKVAEKTDDTITFAPVTASGMAAFFATMRRQSTQSSFSESQAGTPEHVIAAPKAPAVNTNMSPAAPPVVPAPELPPVVPTPAIPTPTPLVVEVKSSQTPPVPVVKAVFDESGKVRRMSELGITTEMENSELERVMKMDQCEIDTACIRASNHPDMPFYIEAVNGDLDGASWQFGKDEQLMDLVSFNIWLDIKKSHDCVGGTPVSSAAPTSLDPSPVPSPSPGSMIPPSASVPAPSLPTPVNPVPRGDLLTTPPSVAAPAATPTVVATPPATPNAAVAAPPNAAVAAAPNAATTLDADRADVAQAALVAATEAYLEAAKDDKKQNKAQYMRFYRSIRSPNCPDTIKQKFAECKNAPPGQADQQLKALFKVFKEANEDWLSSSIMISETRASTERNIGTWKWLTRDAAWQHTAAVAN